MLENDVDSIREQDRTGDHETLSRLRHQHQSELAFDVRMLANRSVITGAGNPAPIGWRLTEYGIRYGAVLGQAAAKPFFSAAVLACERAATMPAQKNNATVYDELYARFLTHYGLFVAAALEQEREDPADTTHLTMALANLTMAFTAHIGGAAHRAPGSFRTPEFSAYSLTVLSLAYLARLWNITVDEETIARVGEIQITRHHDAMRRALYARLMGEESNEFELAKPFRALFNVREFSGVFVSNLQLTHAYACSLARFGGRMTSALTRLLRD